MSGPGFHICCTCGPGGSMIERVATKVNHCARIPRYFGDPHPRSEVRAHNRCLSCGKLWLAPPKRGEKINSNQTAFAF